MRLIDADALKADLQKFFPEECLDGITSRTLFAQILTDISNAPTSEYPCVVKVKTKVDSQRVSDELRRLAKMGVIFPVEDIEVKRLQRPQGDLISREALLKAMEEERRYLLARGQTGAEHIIVHHCLPIIDNAPTVERPQGECENCDFRKFTETFVDGVVEVMNKNGITSVEQLSEILKGGAE